MGVLKRCACMCTCVCACTYYSVLHGLCADTHTHVQLSFSRSLQLCVSCVAGCGHYILWTNHPTGSDGDIPGR